jgi:uncharacterized protein (TIGR03437 family)
VVTVDGQSSVAQTVSLAAISPGIFTPGILNEDNSVNGITSPASAGSVIQVFATGLPAGSAGVFAKIHDRDALVPLYAGAAPGIEGLEQVNLIVPADLPAMTTDLTLCAYNVKNEPICSPAAKLTVSAGQ